MRRRMKKNDRAHARRFAMLPRTGAGAEEDGEANMGGMPHVGFIPTGAVDEEAEVPWRKLVLPVRTSFMG
jgi:hypothetical protein